MIIIALYYTNSNTYIITNTCVYNKYSNHDNTRKGSCGSCEF